ncbi:tyrosine-type recombinase/integrase [Chloroflexus sp.]|uniref:tyrosine-type recombinase/integrase n=1 Tax=Chloroflexus sp. TaxID=1904827 RepID=UPI00298F104F|nr:tyrosine-type recombinase/integrase [Chloroflexus sp.]MCS6889294.1 tyrosine-type recombinase/integrase [Chloroflexus sp.]MCX7860637.1 tyrosine-type recombinase/integrase [Chloroflexus sp.]MDW8403321.1 tyrosine-type recombinase/integrase [Chloroflexus sp.]
MMNDLAEQPLTPDTPIAVAGAIWLARLASAGLDENGDDDDLDERTRESQRHHARQTIASYETALRIFTRWAERNGRQRLGELQIGDLVAYARALRKRSYDLSQRAATARESGQRERLSERTVHAYVRPLFGFLALADSQGAIPFRVAAARPEVSRVLPRLPTPVAPTPPDLRRLVRFYDKPSGEERERQMLTRLRNAALLHLLFSSGARISEALSLDVGDVARDRRILPRVIVRGKGRREGTLFIRKHAEQALHRYLAARNWPPAREPLFVAFDPRTGGGRLSRISGWRIVTGAAHALADQMVWEGKADEAELLRQVTPHTFRHFVGYHLLNEGVALAEVSQILRHRSVEVTRSFYASYADVQLQEVHDQFSADPWPDDA